MCLVASGAAQNPPPSPPQAPAQTTPVFRSSVDVVQVDVSVLDKDRHPIQGLTADNFTILEDGKPQNIVAFKAIDVVDPGEPPAVWMKTVSPDVRTNNLQESRLFVLVLDDALIPMDPAATKAAKDIARRVVEKLGPNDLASIVMTGDNRNAQNFTNDHARLLAAIDKLAPGLAGYAFGYDAPGDKGAMNMDSYFFEAAVDTLRNVADYLVAVPQQRKTVIWVSPGVPVDPESNGPVAISGLGSSGVADREVQMALVAEMAEIFRRAQRANVMIYPIDPTGPGGMEHFIANRLASRLGANAQEFAHKQAGLQLDFVEAIAANTGGTAIVNTNDFEAGITQLFRENGSYYLLGFQSTNSKADGGLRRISVKVDQPGAEVHTRQGYYAADAAKAATAAKAAAASPLATAMASLLPSPDMPMQVTLAPFALPKGKGPVLASVAVILGVRQPAREEASRTRVVEDVELQTSAFTPEGDSKGSTRATAHIALREGATGEFRYEVVSHIDLPPGRYELRLATHSGSLGKSGSVFTDLQVPNFADEPVSLSGVVIGATPAIASGPKDALSTLLPFAPTAEREFLVTSKVTAFLRVYQGGKSAIVPIALKVRIVDGHDKTVADQTEALDPNRFDKTRAADYRFPLPLTRLTRGPYVLTFETTLGKTSVRRDVRFTVR
jgi:VWFA-related protein